MKTFKVFAFALSVLAVCFIIGYLCYTYKVACMLI